MSDREGHIWSFATHICPVPVPAHPIVGSYAAKRRQRDRAAYLLTSTLVEPARWSYRARPNAREPDHEPVQRRRNRAPDAHCHPRPLIQAVSRTWSQRKRRAEEQIIVEIHETRASAVIEDGTRLLEPDEEAAWRSSHTRDIAVPALTGRSVADAMIHSPKVCGPTTSIAQLRDMLRDDHVHAALIVDHGELLAVVERSDLVGSLTLDGGSRAAAYIEDRVTRPDAGLAATWKAMTTAGRRRLAVIDSDRQLLGLLCLKRSGLGFCSDADVRARADASVTSSALAARTRAVIGGEQRTSRGSPQGSSTGKSG